MFIIIIIIIIINFKEMRSERGRFALTRGATTCSSTFNRPSASGPTATVTATWPHLRNGDSKNRVRLSFERGNDS